MIENLDLYRWNINNEIEMFERTVNKKIETLNDKFKERISIWFDEDDEKFVISYGIQTIAQFNDPYNVSQLLDALLQCQER